MSHPFFIFWNYTFTKRGRREKICVYDPIKWICDPPCTLTTYTVIPLVQISSNCWKNCGWVRKKQTNSFFAKRMNKWGTCHRIRAIHYVINYFISFDIKLFPLVEPHWFYVLYKYFAIMHFTFFFWYYIILSCCLANLPPKQQMTISI